MECKPQVSKDTFKDLEKSNDKLHILYDMQAATMECLEHVSKVVEKRKYFDKVSTVIGGIVGGVLGSLGIRINS